MRRILLTASILTLFGCLVLVRPGAGQDKAPRVLIETKGWGSLKGRVIYDGAVPEPESLVAAMQAQGDKACCLAGKEIEKIKSNWIVDPKTGGVGYVLIYLKAPAGKYFPIHDNDKTRKDTVEIDQPHCQFLPPLAGFYPSYYDGKANVPTGQKFLVKNSATVTHNIRASGNPKYGNTGFNVTLPPGTEKNCEFSPQPLPILLNCDIHTWMNGRVGVFEHPYFAVTKEDGTFTIPRVPAGAEVTVMGWHELYVPSKDGIKMTFKEGENVLPEIKIKK